MSDGIDAVDFERLIAWLQDTSRKPAALAFTAGAARDAATAVEESGVLAVMATLRLLRDAAWRVLANALDCPQAHRRTVSAESLDGLRAALEGKPDA